MKWPSTLTFIRHGESAFNILKGKKLADHEYVAFKERFDKEYAVAQDDTWASPELQAMARKIWGHIRLNIADSPTPLTEAGMEQARKTGERLPELIEIPDIIYVSPYARTLQTLEMITASWPALRDVKTIHEERIREQEHGLYTIYNDWSVYLALNPAQGILRKLEDHYEYRVVNGENLADVRERGRSMLASLIREHHDEKVLMVSHHMTLLAFRALLERWDREKFTYFDRNEQPANCGVTIYRGKPDEGPEGRLVLDIYNKVLY